MSHRLNAVRRSHELSELADGREVDVLVVGGGVVGAGVALDAVTRGLSVALVERDDLASGTSRWSSKLAHGGLRYLASGDVGVAWESAVERAILADRTAPHLIRALPQLLPLGPDVGRVAERLLLGGMRAGDAMRRAAGTSADRLPPARRVTAAEAARWVPGLGSDGVRGGLLSWDGQLEDDARLVVSLARTAAGFGARVLTRVRVEAVSGGGAVATDLVSGSRLSLRARHVVNATGVWASALAPSVMLRPSRGSHLLVPAARLGDPAAALTVPVPGAFGRFVFALPRPDGLVLCGITDEPVDGPPPAVPVPTPEEESFLLATIGRALDRPLSAEDVVGRFAGLRPLLDAGAGTTADVSRRHAVLEDPDSGVVTVVGGKLTTYRRMAQDAVDLIAARPGVAAGPCRTTDLPVVGAAPPSPADSAALRSAAASELGSPHHRRSFRGSAPAPRSPDGRSSAPAPRSPGDLPLRLVRRYGTEAAAVAACAVRPDELSPLAPGVPYCVAELRFAIEAEGALDVGDLLDRRTRIGLVPAWREAALPAAERVLDEARVLA